MWNRLSLRVKIFLDNTQISISDEDAIGLKWLRYVMSPDDHVPKISDWDKIYHFANKQKILGICTPSDDSVSIQRDLLFKWIGEFQQIKIKSTLLNRRTVELYVLLQKAGFQCCILKGQGNAAMYPNPLKRMPGDIDVWIDADERSIHQYVKSVFPDAEESFKHIKFPVFPDIPVDIHCTPLKFRYPVYQRRLQKWIKENKDEQFKHHVRLTGTDVDIAVPTARFNVVYQLGHILTHLFDEGIGLRHLVDYYYLLKQLEGISETEKEQIREDWKELGLIRLAHAIMWIEHEVLGLPQDNMIDSPDSRLGNKILKDVLEGGNFGKYSHRMENVGRGRFTKRMATFRRLISFMPYFPGEIFFRLIARTKGLIKIEIRKVISII